MNKLVLLIILNIFFLTRMLPAQQLSKPLIVDEKAPTFYLKTIDGKDFYLRDFCGKLRQPWKNKTQHVLVISFFATWCLPCMKEIPELERIADKYKDENVKVLLVDVKEKKELITQFNRDCRKL